MKSSISESTCKTSHESLVQLRCKYWIIIVDSVHQLWIDVHILLLGSNGEAKLNSKLFCSSKVENSMNARVNRCLVGDCLVLTLESVINIVLMKS